MRKKYITLTQEQLAFILKQYQTLGAYIIHCKDIAAYNVSKSEAMEKLRKMV